MDMIQIAFLIGNCLSLRRMTRWPIEIMPLIVMSSLIILFYLFGYFNHLLIGYRFIETVSFLNLLILPIILWLERKQLWTMYFTPGFVIFSLLFLVCAWISLRFTEIEWDALSRWIPFAKIIAFNDRLLNVSDPVVDKDYPPGAALFYYFFLKGRRYSESQLFIAQAWMILAPLILILYRYPWKLFFKAFNVLLILLLILVCIFKVKMLYHMSLMMDEPSALLFGGLIAGYFVLSNEKMAWLYFSIPMTSFVFYRPGLYFFVILITTIMLVDQWLQRKSDSIDRKQMLGYATLLVWPALLLYSFHQYVSHAVFLSHPMHCLFKCDAFRISDVRSVETLKTISYIFVRSLLSPLMGVLVFNSLVVWMYRHISDRFTKRRLLTSSSILLIGFIFYLIALWVLYLFYMPFDERSPVLNSLNRFISIYMIGWFIVIYAQCISFNINLNESPLGKILYRANINKVIAVFLVLGTAVMIKINLIKSHHEWARQSNLSYFRLCIKNIVQIVNQRLPMNHKLGIIWDDESLWVARAHLSYEFLPRSVEYYNYPVRNNELFHEPNGIDDVLMADTRQQLLKVYANDISDWNVCPLMTIALCLPLEDDDCHLTRVSIYLFHVVTMDEKKRLVNAVECSSVPKR